MLSPYDYAKWQYELALLKNENDLSSYTQYFGEYQDLDLYKNVEGNDWQDTMYGRTGNTFNHNVNITGGTDNVKYAFSYAHMNVKAFMVDADNNESLAVEQNISAQEIEAGVLTVKGLQPETKYIIRLYNGEKKRGEKTITTIADLYGATLVHEGDDFRAMIEAAEDGQVFALYGGTHFIADEDEGGKTGAAKVAKSIVIKGIYPTNIPVVKGRFEILDGASLELNVLDTEGKTNMFIDESGKAVENPNYKDAANGDFTIGNEDVKKLGVGDPRWR